LRAWRAFGVARTWIADLDNPGVTKHWCIITHIDVLSHTLMYYHTHCFHFKTVHNVVMWLSQSLKLKSFLYFSPYIYMVH
jgi:hypothetical protein